MKLYQVDKIIWKKASGDVEMLKIISLGKHKAPPCDNRKRFESPCQLDAVGGKAEFLIPLVPRVEPVREALHGLRE